MGNFCCKATLDEPQIEIQTETQPLPVIANPPQKQNKIVGTSTLIIQHERDSDDKPIFFDFQDNEEESKKNKFQPLKKQKNQDSQDMHRRFKCSDSNPHKRCMDVTLKNAKKGKHGSRMTVELPFSVTVLVRKYQDKAFPYFIAGGSDSDVFLTNANYGTDQPLEIKWSQGKPTDKLAKWDEEFGGKIADHLDIRSGNARTLKCVEETIEQPPQIEEDPKDNEEEKPQKKKSQKKKPQKKKLQKKKQDSSIH